ncbi:MAG: hypothetical protein ICV73_20470, partial [Acetobacteraceae bacterium]|nr:hypothetical protein [Acetobacteraceae bacterium]
MTSAEALADRPRPPWRSDRMTKEFLRERERALEDVFFAQQDQALLRRL